MRHALAREAHSAIFTLFDSVQMCCSFERSFPHPPPTHSVQVREDTDWKRASKSNFRVCSIQCRCAVLLSVCFHTPLLLTLFNLEKILFRTADWKRPSKSKFRVTTYISWLTSERFFPHPPPTHSVQFREDTLQNCRLEEAK